MERPPTRKAPRAPPEETPEEAGERVIRALLEMPSPEQTLEEDLRATLARITHRTIAELQRELQRKRFTICRDTAAQTETYLREHPTLTEEERRSKKEAAAQFARQQVAAYREATSLTIAAILQEGERRAAALHAFCSTRQNNGVV